MIGRLLGFGRAIDSLVAVPGAVPRAQERLAAIRIEPAAPPPERGTDALYTVEDAHVLFSPPGIGRYRCAPDTIEVAARPDADPAAVSALLIATALPACLWMQGRFMLHAAAVRPAGCNNALAIAGHSGSGKSTIAAALIDRGAGLVGDDSLCLAHEARAVSASGLPGGLHLTDSTGERRFRPLPIDRSVPEASLGAIVVLTERGSDWSITPLGTIAAVEALLAHRHRPAVPALIGAEARVLADCAAIARAVPVFAWRRPRGQIAIAPAEHAALAQCLAAGGKRPLSPAPATS